MIDIIAHIWNAVFLPEVGDTLICIILSSPFIICNAYCISPDGENELFPGKAYYVEWGVPGWVVGQGSFLFRNSWTQGVFSPTLPCFHYTFSVLQVRLLSGWVPSSSVFPVSGIYHSTVNEASTVANETPWQVTVKLSELLNVWL